MACPGGCSCSEREQAADCKQVEGRERRGNLREAAAEQRVDKRRGARDGSAEEERGCDHAGRRAGEPGERGAGSGAAAQVAPEHSDGEEVEQGVRR